MSALSKNKNINNLGSRFLGSATLPVKAGEIIYAGAAVAVVAGEWQNVTATTGLEGRVAEATAAVDNTVDGHVLASRFYDKAGKWVVPFRNDTGVAPVVAANLGDEVYFKDNQTISIDDDGAARSRAGRAWKFGDSGPLDSGDDQTIVFVEVY